ncbi:MULTISPECIES: DUF2155 domain-containing protein [Mesorhizobium]|uniref:DUF2155 domain-containing protein n=1 Tax=Rhizobium loti TaxID=381 RepID=A0A8E2W6K4_RHILI|nr:MULTISPECIES: DUF2155 domain-containing protein [Mesorhizobium]PWJ87069.1 hypothetical protein C8D77_11952 [Mesorhizobium loti]
MSFFSLTSMGGLMVAAGLAVSTAALAASPEPAAPAPAPPAGANRVTNPVAEFAGIDKITGRIITFDVYIDETVQFGALQVTPRVCYSRPQTEEPKTDSFVEVDEITLDRKIRRIFTGWMFAESPGLNAVEHAVYDVWLKECKQKSDVPAPDGAKADATKAEAPKPAAAKPKPAATPDVTEPDVAEPDASEPDTTDSN